MMEFILAKYNYWIYVIIMMIGFYAVIAKSNLIKKIIGLSVFQTSVFLLFISIGKVDGGTVPIYQGTEAVYINPLPHVLILTAIVVGVSVTAVAFALVVNIYREYGTIEENAILEMIKHDD
ncbi:MAG: cation:proton antiporter subunit C [Syntrophomonadaceae bacterium]|nr:cation:proton antiporter subunit C [Syntrophomonadaceae bacterium]